MIIDCHCHAGQGDGLTGPWDTSAPLERYLRRARAAGISRTVLFPCFHSDYSTVNRALALRVASDPDRFFGFAFVHSARDRGRIWSMIAEADEMGLCGIKAHRSDARLSRELCEVATIFRLPLLYDAMGEISVVELAAAEYPDLDFIIPHLGSFVDDWRAHTALIDLLVRYPNVYTDTAGVRRFDFLVTAIERAGPGKVLFGTDGPWLHPGVELAKVFALELPIEERRLILAGNLLKILQKRQAAQCAVVRRPDPALATRTNIGQAAESRARA